MNGGLTTLKLLYILDLTECFNVQTIFLVNFPLWFDRIININIIGLYINSFMITFNSENRIGKIFLFDPYKQTIWWSFERIIIIFKKYICRKKGGKTQLYLTEKLNHQDTLFFT